MPEEPGYLASNGTWDQLFKQYSCKSPLPVLRVGLNAYLPGWQPNCNCESGLKGSSSN